MATTPGAGRSAAGSPQAPVLRPYRGPQDHYAMRRVANQVRAANGDPLIGSVAEMDAFYRRFDQAALTADCAIVEVDRKVVGYARATWEPLSTGETEVGGIVAIDPDRSGEGIEQMLVDHIVQRSRTLIQGQGAERSTFVRVFVGDYDAALRAALEAAGFSIVRAAAQLIRPSLDDIPEVPLPDGLEIRPIPADDEAMVRKVWEADGRAFADTWGHELPTERAYESWRSSPSLNPPLWRVAFQGDTIAGQILNSLGEPDDDGTRTGFTEAISVQPEFRRRGLARALLAASLRAVRDAGATRAGLGVDSQNPNQAQALYESMGYRVVSVTYGYELGPFPPSAQPMVVPEAGR